VTHEQQIISGMAHTRIDAAKRALTEGETFTAKNHLRSAITKIEQIENIAPENQPQPQKRSTAFLEIEAKTETK